MNWVTIRKAIYDWVVAGSELPAGKVVWARQPGSPRPAAPAIIMEISAIDDAGQSWTDVDNMSLTFADLTISAVDDTADTLTITGHGLLTGDGPVRIGSTGTVPGGLLAATDYWVIKVDDDTIQLAASFVDSGGTQPDGSTNPQAAIDITSAGTGTITLADTADTLRGGQEIQHVVRGIIKATLTLHAYTAKDVDMDACTAILQRVVMRAKLPTQQAIMDAANAGYVDFDRVRTMIGVRDATLFEPRAWVDITLNLVSEEREFGTIIERAEITNLNTGLTFQVPEE